MDDFLLKELEYRREKQWRIFSWSGGLLTAITALVASDMVPDPSKGIISVSYRFALSVALAGIAIYALKWLNYNYQCEKEARCELEKIRPNIVPQGFFRKPPFFGYDLAICFLVVAGIIALWLAPICCWVHPNGCVKPKAVKKDETAIIRSYEPRCR